MGRAAADSGWLPQIQQVALKALFSMSIPSLPSEPRRSACHECGGLHPEEDLLRLGATRVCAQCKPIHLQRLREGASPAPSDPAASTFASGRYIVVLPGAVPPPRCVLCNEPGTWHQRMSYSWHPNWLILTLACTPLALVVLAPFFSRAVQFDLVLCADHSRKRTQRLVLLGAWIVVGAVMLVGGMFALRAGLSKPAAICIVVSGLISVLMGPLFAQRASWILIARRIDPDRAYLRGAHPAYRSSLPPWTGDPP